jgi:outer membrane protein OmpA-like peptidoglycan-associated protein
MTGVTAELVELRQSGGVLRLAVRFMNARGDDEDRERFVADRIVLVDLKSKRKYFPIKSASGQFIAGPIGDWISGGRIRLRIRAKQSTIVWAYFEPLPAGTVVSVEMPTVFPFENVAVTEGPSKVFAATTAKSASAGAIATLVSARRADQVLTVRLRLEAEKGASPNIGGPYFEHKDVFVLDHAGKQKYTLIKDTEGRFQAQPNTVNIDGGRFIHDWTKTTLVSLSFPAPPDTVQTVDLLLPLFLPFEGVKIEGTGGAAAGGMAAAGKSLGLEGALKELQAQVTAQEIKIDLSADVLFDLDKSELKPAAEEKLNHLLTIVSSKPESRVAIEGHTDVRGEAPYNQALSERRAGSVRGWLVTHGIATGRISATGAGESRPVRTGNTEADHQANRRVEIRIRG